MSYVALIVVRFLIHIFQFESRPEPVSFCNSLSVIMFGVWFLNVWFTALLGLTETFLASFSFSGSGKMWDARGGGGGLPSLAEILRRPQA